MTPREVSYRLRTISHYINQNDTLKLEVIQNNLQKILVATESHISGQVTKFIQEDYEAATNGLGQLIAHLTKAAKTLNPQDEAQEALSDAIGQFRHLQKVLQTGFNSLRNVEI